MSKKFVNIGGNKQDNFYRYKRPVIQAKVEKPGTNGVKTVVNNMRDIAYALKVIPEYPTKFFGYELGSQASYVVSSDRTCTIIKGSHTVESLERVLEEFIRIFILCPKCELPEIRLSVNKSKVRIQCYACGYEGGLTKSHRLENFILKNPPKKAPKLSSKPVEPIDAKLPEQSSETEVWSCDPSAEGQKERRKEFSAEKPEKSEDSKEDKYQVLKRYVKDGASVSAISSEMDRLQLAHSLSLVERNRILLGTLIDCAKPLATQFAKQSQVLQKFITDKKSGVSMIGSIEELLSGYANDQKESPKKSLIDRMPMVLDKLYQAGVLTEEMILEWWKSPPEASLGTVSAEDSALGRKAVQPFIEWLQTAEEE